MSKVLFIIFVYVAFLFGAALLFAIPVMLLWDWLMPVIFGLKPITLLQAWGLNVLTAFLFKNVSTESKS